MSLNFVPIKDFVKEYRRNVEIDYKADDDLNPRLFVWESFQFCDCEGQCISDSDPETVIRTLKERVDMIAVNRRALKQVDYNYKPCYHVNDYYFTLKDNPGEIFALYTNILLTEWLQGKWHRNVDKVVNKLLCLANPESMAPFIISDTYKDFSLGKGYHEVDEYYDRDTLIFPEPIASATETDNARARDVADALGFCWPTHLASGK